ncbi:DNA methyltransferase [Mesorhizobium sp. Cs1321R2N1]|uniref:DNA methyltransferase n=1 Tax=Mesorhizobium sp. Cs1321R2N1 TaxID=3015174 RepID=UPI00301E4B8C
MLWIGYLKWQLKTAGLASITEPILDAYGTIKQQDALIVFDRQELLRDGTGRPLSRWDGVTKKLHPITGEEIPDPDATVPRYSYVNPKRAPWPEVEFVVGNPPFIGGKDMRQELGDGYAEACWAARPHLPGGADFVMHFWDEAATRMLRKPLKGQTNPLKRFGFITTNSITQTFSRRVIERYMAAKEPLSLIFAVPDHPWMKAADKAAVRIAMTVAEKGDREGVLAEVASEAQLNTDTPQVLLDSRDGKVRADLTIGADLSRVAYLNANELLASRGVALHGAGFIVTPAQAKGMGLGTVDGLENHILDYRNGRDIAQRPRGVMVIDLYPLAIADVQSRFSSVYQHVVERVKPERESNREDFRREYWWWFGRRHTDLREFLDGLPRYIATVETTRHRTFQFLDAGIRPDNMLVCIGLETAEHLTVLSSRPSVVWAIATGGWLGVGNDPRYSKSRTFDPFPFPLAANPKLGPNDPLFAQQERLRGLGERLDHFRKQRLAAYPFLTMTGLYNALERLRELDNGCDVPPLSDAERDVHQAGLISVLKEIHDDIDRAVLAAYGWEDLIPSLVGKPGATLPSPHKTVEQERAEEDLLTRLVALNHERAVEEMRGLVRWLRPGFQIPKLGVKAPKPEGEHVGTLDIEMPVTGDRPKWPTDGLEQIRIVRDLLAKALAPTPSEAIASVFDGRNTGKRKDRVEQVLRTLVATGLAREVEGQRYFLPR